MPFSIVRQDITRMHVDAIVNAANTDLVMGGGVCGAIFRAAGAARMQAACNKAAPIRTGEAAITPGYDLPAKYVIHAAGPIYRPSDGRRNAVLLRSAYLEALRLARENACRSIAFPLISSGIYGYPKEEALQVAVAAIREFLEENSMDVYLVIFDRTSFVISEKRLEAVKQYIDRHFVDGCRGYDRIAPEEDCQMLREQAAGFCANAAPVEAGKGLDDWIGHMDEPFHVTLFRLIDASGKTDVEVYKRANIDRKLFSKIRGGKGYMPGKRTILALAVALELTLEETDDLLERAGYALSHSKKFDVIVEYFIVSGIYDIFEINEVLFQYDQPLLGAS